MSESAPTFNSVEALNYTPPSGDWRVMHETDPATIQTQIEAGILHDGSPANFLNNLADDLPGGRRRNEMLAEKYPQKFGPDARLHNPESWDEWQRTAHSERMAHATRGEFAADIEAAVADAAQDPTTGITRDSLVALNTARTARRFFQNPDELAPLLGGRAQEAYAADGNLEEAFAVNLLPVYARLREKGYSHYDLFQ